MRKDGLRAKEGQGHFRERMTVMKRIDLHTHSLFSDGSMTPEELVFAAKQAGLSAIALTDHDTTDGLARAMAEGQRLGVEVVPGV